MLTFAGQEEYYMKMIDDNIRKISALCEKHKVSRMFAFGSVLTNRFNENSDVDLMVAFNKKDIQDYFDNFFELKHSLEKLFGRDVDLLEEQMVQNPYLKKNIDSTKALIYG